MGEQKRGFKEWWSQMRPTKSVVLSSWIISIIVTIVVGFCWGGWVTAATARKLAQTMADDTLAERLGAVCVVQFHQDPDKEQKLEELKSVNRFQRRDYVEDQGWAIMPGEEEADDKVIDECVRLLMLIDP